MTGIEIVDFERLHDAICKSPNGDSKTETYGDWKKFHDGLVSVLQKHCKVGTDPSVQLDVYHTLNWFDSLKDGFALYTTKAITEECLLALNRLIAEQFSNCTVVLEGTDDIMNLDDLKIFISASEILIGWYEESEYGCMLKLVDLGVTL
jgi:hypothetical protein